MISIRKKDRSCCDLEIIADDNPDAADRVFAEICPILDDLFAFPHTGRRRPDLYGRPLRFSRVYDYLIACAPDEKPLWVMGERPVSAALRSAAAAETCRARLRLSRLLKNPSSEVTL